MKIKEQKMVSAEQRKYLRLDTVFPVQFRLEEQTKEVLLSGWLQGFTNNISRGGICLTINNLDPQLGKLLRQKDVKLSLEIDIPTSRKSIPARGGIVWVRDVPGEKPQYVVGVNYDYILVQHNNQLMRYAWFRKLFAPLILAVVIVLASGLSINSYLNFKLTQGNKLLIEKLSGVLQDSELARQRIEKAVAQGENFQSQLNQLQARIKFLEAEKLEIQAGDAIQIGELNDLIAGLTKEKKNLEETLAEIKRDESQAVQELVQLDDRKLVLEKANFDRMYQWLKLHQNQRSGLVASFEGDKEITSWSFTYDLALLVQAYAKFGDFDRAKKILDFFNHGAKRENGWFLNAYYVDDGAPAEFIMHSGPNLWVGLAILQYMQATQDKSYLELAESIAQTIMDLQRQDAFGGIRGGPHMEWYATEHNLDAYAFFNMLAEVTQKPVYAQAAQKTIDWMVSNTYAPPDLPVKRGKGDATIATDTYAWSIAAVGPEKLFALGMDPDQILEFVEENCSVEVVFKRSDQESVRIKGFDFAPQRHTARGGVVSSEWTAQMIVAYKIMDEFYTERGDLTKAAGYAKKAQIYLNELGKMIISSSSASGQGQGCLPYATLDQVDTGHGWMTPKGSHTGSASGTAYALFAYYGFNPLKLKK